MNYLEALININTQTRTVIFSGDVIPLGDYLALK